MGILDIFKNKANPSNSTKHDSLNANPSKPSFLSKITKLVIGKSHIDDKFLDQIEELLITSDVDVDTAVLLIDKLQESVSSLKYTKTEEIVDILKKEILSILPDNFTYIGEYFSKSEESKPYVILVVGINGVGKTTSIAKLANLFIKQGKKVVLGAGDTFRAAAGQQIKYWGDKVGAEVIGHEKISDPASVAYDAVEHAFNTNADVVIVDTAGRLHNKVALMNELAKIKRVVQKFLPEAPHEVLLVLDGSMGQNCFSQVSAFMEVTKVNSIMVTKLDGTAKGGGILGLYNKFKIPIRFIGTGEGVDNISLFDKVDFVNSLF